MREPEGIGAVVCTSLADLYVRTRPDYDRAWYSLRANAYMAWDEIDHLRPVVLIGPGYTPPTPEPTGELAVVRDGEGVLRYRTTDCRLAVWARADDAGFCPWDEVPQPVEILFAGVPDA